jgi:hypothetical protein
MRRLCCVITVLAAMCACGSSGTSTANSTVNASRPSTPVKITVISPTNGEVIHGTSLDVVVAISGGEIVKTTSTHISPTQGHVHLYLQNQLIYMAYSTSQVVPVQPGVTYSFHVEFVASDHRPFDPRDVTPTIFFTVAPS